MSTWVAARPGHGAVVVSGADATTFLQSLVSQDLAPVDVGEGVRSLLLTPQGKLDVMMRMLRVAENAEDCGDCWWLDCEAGYGARLAESLQRYRIRVDVEVHDRSDAWGLLEVRGHEAVPRVAAAAHVDLGDAGGAHVAWGERRVVRADWPDRPGVDVIGPLDDVRAARDELLHVGVPPVAPGEYEAARIEAGVARLGVDVDERTIPQEAFLEREGVSFTKGCFLGQELVCRIDTRGHVNRYLRRLQVAGATVPEVGADVVVGDATVGTVTSAAVVPGAPRAVALAMVRREVEVPGDVRVRWGATEVSAVVEPVPGSGA
jgi:folate-binding protein YgfZ